MSGDKPIQRQTQASKGLPAQGKAPVGDRRPPTAPAFKMGKLLEDRFDATSMAVPGLSYRDLYGARDWKPGAPGISGSEVNKKITQAYIDLDRAMTAYLGEPKGMNWTTFGKYASRSAGEQILKLEAIERAKRLDPGAASSLLIDAVRDPKSSFKQAKALFDGANPKTFLDNARKLRQALVNGNTGIMIDIGPAYHIFLKAEAEGKDGMTALRAAGYGAAPKDPQNFVVSAFRRYQTAKKLSDEIQARCKALGIKDPGMVQSDPLRDALEVNHARFTGSKMTPRAELIKLMQDRDDALLEANLYLGMQEQYCTLQTPQVFEDKDIERIIGALSGSMMANDVTGVTPLLPEGGNWANFFDRMGLREAKTEEERNYRFYSAPPINLWVDGRNHVLVPNDKPGTIFEYFKTGHNMLKVVEEGGKFREVPDRPLLRGNPEPLPAHYDRNPLNLYD